YWLYVLIYNFLKPLLVFFPYPIFHEILSPAEPRKSRAIEARLRCLDKTHSYLIKRQYHHSLNEALALHGCPRISIHLAAYQSLLEFPQSIHPLSLLLLLALANLGL